MSYENSSTTKVKEHTFTALPLQVDINDIKDKENMLLLTEAQIAKVQEYFKDNSEKNRVSNKVLREKFPASDFPNYGYVVRFGNPLNNEPLQYFMVYRGKNNILGEGTFGKAKLMQRLVPQYAADGRVVSAAGNWYTAKIPKIRDISNRTKRYFRQKNTEKESNLLKDIGLGIGHIRREDEENYTTVGIKLIEGISLREYINLSKKHPISLAKKLRIATNILAAYKAQIQDKKLLHRDIKPDNIMIDPINEKITFIDFGFAEKVENGKLNSSRTRGTPDYMAPEVAFSKSKHKLSLTFDEKTEVYALGITLYNLFFPESHDKNHISEIDNLILEAIAEMIDENSEERCTLLRSTHFFNNINDVKIKATDKIENTGLIFVDEYIQASEEEKANIIEALRLADKVLLIDKQANQSNQFNLTFVQQELNKKGIFCNNQVIYLPENITVPVFINQTLLGLVNKKKIDNYFLVTDQFYNQLTSEFLILSMKETANCESILKNYLEKKYVLEASWDIIKKSLTADHQRILNKYNKSPKDNEIIIDKDVDIRASFIIKIIKNLDQQVVSDEGLSVYKLHEQLVALQKEMFANNFLHYIKDWILGENTSISAKMIKGLIREHHLATPAA